MSSGQVRRARPKVSIVVPTRDRPELLKRCLQAIARQGTEDFEVVVCDNPTRLPARAAFDEAADHRFQYIRPDGPLTMHDNWELGCERARGEYVSVVTDKMALHPSTVTALLGVIDHELVDIISWWGEGYELLDEASSIDTGLYWPTFSPIEAQPFDPVEELAFRCSMQVPRAAHGIRYFRGKICFGAFSTRLLEQIRSRLGRVFHPLAPDYTSMILAAAEAPSALDLGRACVLSWNSHLSNGLRCQEQPSEALRFINEAVPGVEISKLLPIPGLYAAVHNIVAFNYSEVLRQLSDDRLPALDLVNLARRAREDLAGVHWPDVAERQQQYEILEAAEARLDIPAGDSQAATGEAAGEVLLPPAGGERVVSNVRRAVAERIARFPRIERLGRRVRGRPTGYYTSILDAVVVADEHARGVLERAGA